MPRPNTLAIAVSALCATLHAQDVRTLPAGLARTESPHASSFPFDAGVSFHYQEVHRPAAGAHPAAFTGILFRRGIKTANPTAVARAADLTLRMGHGDHASFYRTFANNFQGAPTTVLPNTRVQLPDWSEAKNPSERLRFDLEIPFTTPFAHNGTNDIVWEIYVQNPGVAPGTDYVTERVSGVLPYALRRATVELTGCTATGRAQPMAHRVSLFNYGPGHGLHPMRAEFYSGNNPAFAPVTMAFGFQKLDMPIGFCTNLYVMPRTYVPLGTADFHGTDVSLPFDLPFTPAAIQLTMRTQCYAPDPSQPTGIVLSNGCEIAMPGFVERNTRFRYIHAASVSATTGVGPFDSGAVLTGYR